MRKQLNTIVELTEHLLEGTSNELQIYVLDFPGAGNANHYYEISGFNTNTNPSCQFSNGNSGLDIYFQNGTIPEKGVNGVTIESLLAVCADRLRSFQAGPFACDDNQDALDNISNAIKFLQKRTRSRIARQVEGKEIV